MPNTSKLTNNWQETGWVIRSRDCHAGVSLCGCTCKDASQQSEPNGGHVTIGESPKQFWGTLMQRPYHITIVHSAWPSHLLVAIDGEDFSLLEV